MMEAPVSFSKQRGGKRCSIYLLRYDISIVLSRVSQGINVSYEIICDKINYNN